MNLSFLVFQIINLLLITLWLILTIGALIALPRRPLNNIQHFTWTVLIIFVPILGAAAFWILQPDKD